MSASPPTGYGAYARGIAGYARGVAAPLAARGVAAAVASLLVAVLVAPAAFAGDGTRFDAAETTDDTDHARKGLDDTEDIRDRPAGDDGTGQVGGEPAELRIDDQGTSDGAQGTGDVLDNGVDRPADGVDAEPASDGAQLDVEEVSDTEPRDADRTGSSTDDGADERVTEAPRAEDTDDTPDGGQADGDQADGDQADGDQADDADTTHAGELICDDVLAVATPDGVQGDGSVVAITAQAVEAGVPGWTNVAWEPVEGTTLGAVIVSRTDGTSTTRTGAGGSATGVATLTFCGAVDGAEAGDSPAPTSSDPAPPCSTPTAHAPRGGAPATTTTSTSQRPRPAANHDPEAASTTGTANPGTANGSNEANGATGTSQKVVAGVIVLDPPEPPPAGEKPEGMPQDQETEVMGIQLTRDVERRGDGPIGTVLTLLLGIALIAAAGSVLRSRRS